MGQLIEVAHVVLGDVAIFDTDRSLSGQDGETFVAAPEASEAGTFPGKVATALYAYEPQLASVYVYSNTISVRRPKEWTEAQAAEAGDVIRNFLIYYDENRE